MPTVAGRFKGTDLIIRGEVEERLPRVKNGLVSHFPFDGNVHDKLTQIFVDKVTTTNRDWYGDTFPELYNYADMTLLITGRVMCEEAAVLTNSTSIGITYKLANGTDAWIAAKSFVCNTIQNKWVNFIAQITVPANFSSALRTWIQIGITAGTSGYKIHYDSVNYLLMDDAKYITNVNTDITQEYLSIRESSQNYIQNGDFRNGLANWANGATATTHELIYTPYGPGIRINREDGDNGGWTLQYNGTKDWTYTAGETWVWSFKFKVGRGPSQIPFYIGWWINDNGSYRQNLPVQLVELSEDGWYIGYASYTFVNTYSANVSCGINSNRDFTTIDVTDIRLEKRTFPTSTPDNSVSDDPKLGLAVTLPNIFSLSCEKRFVTESTWNKYGITKDASNNFIFYKNGIATTEYENKWAHIKVRGVGVNRNQGYDIAKYNDPISKTYAVDPFNLSSNLSVDNAGFLMRTFVYCSSAVAVSHKYVANNYGGIRVNNGSLVYLGGADVSVNPTISINLVAGWNIVEIVWMDGDTAGGIYLSTGTPLNQVPEVLYMTAELPIEMSNNQPYFNEKANVDIRNMSIYSRDLSGSEMKAVHSTKGISIDSGGNLNMIVKEALPYLPSDAYYFPLGANAKDINGLISPVGEDNTVYEDGWVWVGRALNNYVLNADGKTVNASYSVPGSYSPGWDAALHPYAIVTNSWNAGYNGGVPSPTIGFHAQWVYEGYTGDNDPCMKFVNRNDLYGNPARWLGIAQALPSTPAAYGWAVGTKLLLQWKQRSTNAGIAIRGGLYYINTSGATGWAGIMNKSVSEANTWETTYHIITLPSDIDLTKACSVYMYGHYSPDGIVWADDIMLAPIPFSAPFTVSSRGEGKLKFNFYDSIGLDWSGDWSIVYFKTPMGTATNNLAGYSIESIGCNGNTVGGGYLWWGKNNGADTIAQASPSTIDPNTYFNNPRMISIVKSGTTVTIKEWDYFGTVFTRTVTITTTAPNAFVTQYGYDFQLGGWDNNNAVNAYYRDLIVAKRAFTNDEVTNLFKTRASSREDAFYISGKIVVNPTLS